MLGLCDADGAQLVRLSEQGQDVLWWCSSGIGLVLYMAGYAPLVDRGVVNQHLHWALEQLLAHRALPGSDATFGLPSSHGASPLLQDLQAQGLLEAEGTHLATQWRLTASGAKRLRFASRFSLPPVPLSRPRPGLSLEDRTTFELLCIARAQGWSWAALPSRAGEREKLHPYRVGDA